MANAKSTSAPLNFAAIVMIAACQNNNSSASTTTPVQPNEQPAEQPITTTGNMDVRFLSPELLRFFHNGSRHDLRPGTHLGNATIYEPTTNSGTVFTGTSFIGEAVEGAAIAFASTNHQDFGNYLHIEGTIANSMPIGMVTYRGALTTTTTVDANGGLITPIHIISNFDSGVFVGHDIENIGIVTLEGNITNTGFAGHGYATYGFFEYEGHFYGANGNEMAATFENGGVSGLLYATSD